MVWLVSSCLELTSVSVRSCSRHWRQSKTVKWKLLTTLKNCWLQPSYAHLSRCSALHWRCLYVCLSVYLSVSVFFMFYPSVCALFILVDSCELIIISVVFFCAIIVLHNAVITFLQMYLCIYVCYAIVKQIALINFHILLLLPKCSRVIHTSLCISVLYSLCFCWSLSVS